MKEPLPIFGLRDSGTVRLVAPLVTLTGLGLFEQPLVRVPRLPFGSAFRSRRLLVVFEFLDLGLPIESTSLLEDSVRNLDVLQNARALSRVVASGGLKRCQCRGRKASCHWAVRDDSRSRRCRGETANAAVAGTVPVRVVALRGCSQQVLPIWTRRYSGFEVFISDSSQVSY